MIPRHLTGYHLLWFNFEAILFLENPKTQQPLCRIAKRGTQSHQIHDSKTKARFKDIKISYTISFRGTGISMIHMHICRLQCAIALSRARCAAAARNHHTGTDHAMHARASRCCALRRWKEGIARGGASCIREGCLGSCAYTPPAVCSWGRLSGSAANMLWVQLCRRGDSALAP